MKKILRILCPLVVLTASACGFSADEASILKNGAPLFYVKETGVPREEITLYFQTGLLALPEAQKGAVNLLLEILKEGPQGMGSEDFKNMKFLESVTVEAVADNTLVEITLRAYPEQLAEKLVFLKTLLEHLKLDPETFADIQKRNVGKARKEFEDPRTVLENFARKDFYKNAPSLTSLATPSEIAKMTLADLQQAAPALLNTSRVFFSALGPLEKSEAAAAIETAFYGANKAWPKYEKRILPPLNADTYKRESRQAVVLHKAPSVNHLVQLKVAQAMAIDQPAGLIDRIAFEILGGRSTGQLRQVLREERGLTYSATASVDEFAFTVDSFANSGHIAALVSGLFAILDDFDEKHLQESTFKSAVGSLDIAYRSLDELAADRLQKQVEIYNKARDAGFYENFLRHLQDVKFDAVQDFAKTKLRHDAGVLYLLGDKDVLLPVLLQNGFLENDIRVVSNWENSI